MCCNPMRATSQCTGSAAAPHFADLLEKEEDGNPVIQPNFPSKLSNRKESDPNRVVTGSRISGSIAESCE